MICHHYQAYVESVTKEINTDKNKKDKLDKYVENIAQNVVRHNFKLKLRGTTLVDSNRRCFY